MGHGVNAISIRSLEEEELRLGSNVEHPAAVGNFLEDALQRAARVAFKRFAAGGVNIAANHGSTA